MTSITQALSAAFVGKNQNTWSEPLARILNHFQNLQTRSFENFAAFVSVGNDARIVFIDESEEGLAEKLTTVRRSGRAFFLVVSDPNVIPPLVAKSLVDDVLVRPFRPVEVLSKLKHTQQIMRWDEVQTLNQSFQQVIEQLKEDLSLAERIQKARLPKRFDDLRGFKIQSRYLSGLKPGGDYFDIIESDPGDQVVLLLTDSSSYGLSSAVLTVLMRVAVRLGSQDLKDLRAFLKRIYDEVLITLGERDNLSLVIAVVSRKDLSARYVSLGECGFFVRASGSEQYRELSRQGDAIRKGVRVQEIAEGTARFNPGDRILLASDGFLKAAGGKDAMLDKLAKLQGKDAVGLLNELAYRAKKSGVDPDFPPEDCTGIILDIDPKMMRLA